MAGSKACAMGFWQCRTHSCVQFRTNLWVGKCEVMKPSITQVELRVALNPTTGHFWNGKTWRNGRSVALCGANLYPRVPGFFMTEKEMKEVPFCPTCLTLIER